jgi:nicotinate phosphoribosyltransferase
MDDCELALSTDLYELTMAAAYFDNHEEAVGTFELFVRSYPKNRSYLIAAGLQQAIDYLKKLRFEEKQIDFLKRHPNFKDVSSSFFKYLARFRFSGDLWAMPEGTVFFTNEPIIRVTAPIIEAQVIETYLLSVINFETLIATKASRVVRSARGRGVVEFGGRRAHGPESALLAARASYIGGCIGTSNVLAGYKYGIPTYGTVAHSFIMTYDSEREAFERFRKTFPTTPAYLLDTYDTLEAARTVVSLGVKPSLVRLDSGDRYTLSRKVRQILDEAGLKDTKIFVSGDLNEFVLDKLTARKPPIDFFGVGTDLVTSRDDPALPGIYKLVSLTRNGTTTFRAKTSTGKQTIPGAKQVRRLYSHGKIRVDLITLEDEQPALSGKPLLTQIMKRGQVVVGMPSLDRIQGKARTELSSLPIKYRALYGTVKPPIRLSPRLVELTSSLWERKR